jgi:cytochrome c1
VLGEGVLKRLLALGAVLALAACNQDGGAPRWAAFGGDPARGAIVIGRESCGDCHQIPGIQGAGGQVGPPLAHFAERTVVAGLLPNTPDNLTRWIQHPQAMVPGNAMPDAGLTDQQARDVAAYLYSLR